MKQTKTTLKELTAAYRAVLRHGILCNAIALGLIAATPAIADPVQTSDWISLRDGLIDSGTSAMEFTGNITAGAFDPVVEEHENATDGFYVLGDKTINLNGFTLNGNHENRQISIRNDNTVTLTGGGTISNLSYTTGDYLNSQESNIFVAVRSTLALEDGDYTFSNNNSRYGVINVNNNHTDGTTSLTTNNVGTLTFENNTALSQGGALYITGPSDGPKHTSVQLIASDKIEFKNNSVAEESVTGHGGAVMNMGDNTAIVANEVVFDGNHVYADAEHLETNIVKSGGAAVQNAYNGNLTIGKDGGTVTFKNNTSTTNGGALLNRGNALTTLRGDVTFDNNHADVNGGAIYNTSSAAQTVSDAIFTNNTADGKGGAIYNEGTMTLANATFGGVDAQTGDPTGNSAGISGGAIYNTGSMSLSNASFINNVSNGGDGDHTGGGAIYSSGALSLDNVDFISNVTNNGYGGGALRIAVQDSAETTVTNSRFDSNQALLNGQDGGAISLESGRLIVTGSTFNNNVADEGGAIESYTSLNRMTIENSTFSGNEAGAYGAVAIFGKDGVNEIIGSKFTNNRATDTVDGSAYDGGDGGAVYLGSKAKLEIAYTEFTGNYAANDGGAISTRNEHQAQTESGLEIMDSRFESNTAGQRGGAIYANVSNNATLDGPAMIGRSYFISNRASQGGAIYNDEKDAQNNISTLDITDSTFTGNIASDNGGAIYNKGEVILTGGTFTDNLAGGLGGALYNEGTMSVGAMSKDVYFYGNKAGVAFDSEGNVVEGTGTANDIYNTGSLTLNASHDWTMTLTGGISGQEGHNGTLNIGGTGTVEIANSLDYQTVNVGQGKLHLTSPMTLTDTMITVATGAVLNTTDNAINNYSAHTILGNYSQLLVDVSADGIDTFNILSGNTVSVEGFTMLSDLTTASEVRHLSEYGNVTDNPTFKAYTTNSIYTLTGNNANDGTVTINKVGTGGLFNAVESMTDDHYEGIYYSLTDNDASITNSVVLRNGDIDIYGAGTGDGDYGITLGATMAVDDQSTLVFNNAKVEGNGNIEISEGAQTGFNGSKIDVDVINDGLAGIFDTTLVAGNTFETHEGSTTIVYHSTIDADVLNGGRWISDPTTYSGMFENEGSAIFDADTFTSTAVLNNVGTVDLTNGVTFDAGAEIVSNGVINLVNGTTHFNNTESTNTINLVNGADFDGVLIGTWTALTGIGTLNTANGAIDTVTGGVAGGNLIVDADLTGAGTIDTFAGGTTGAKIKTINILNSEYGTAGSLSLNIGGATLDDDLHIDGMNYYTSVTTDGEGNLVFSDKLINRSTLDTELAGYAELVADNTFTGLNTFQNLDGINIKNADASIGANLKVAAYDASYNALYVTGVDGIIANSFAATTGGFMTDHFSADDEAIELKNSSNETVFYATNAGALTLSGIATLGGLQLGTVTVTGINTTVADDNDKLITSGAVYTALDGINTALGNPSSPGVEATGLFADVEANTAALVALNNGANSIANQIKNGAEKATYVAGGHESGTIGAAIDDINTALGHASDAENEIEATGLFATVEGLLSGDNSVSNQIANGAQNATYDAENVTEGSLGEAISQNASDIADISAALGHASDAEHDVEATGLFADVEANTAAISEISTALGHASNGDEAATGLFADVEANTAAISEINTALGHASDAENGIEATGLFATVEGLISGDNSISNQIANNAQNATYDAENVTEGSIGEAISQNASDIADINTALGHASNGDEVATGLFATVEENTAAINQNASDIVDINNALGRASDETNEATGLFANVEDIDGRLGRASDANSGTEATGLFATVETLNGDENTEGSVRNIAKSYFDLAAQNDALTLSQANAYTDERIEKLDKDLSAGIASAVALSSVAVSDVRRGEMSVGAGYGYFNGQSAAAFGAAMGISNRWSVNAGAGVSGYDVSFRAGTNYKFKLF